VQLGNGKKLNGCMWEERFEAVRKNGAVAKCEDVLVKLILLFLYVVSCQGFERL